MKFVICSHCQSKDIRQIGDHYFCANCGLCSNDKWEFIQIIEESKQA